jgi:hypothetical protein
VRVTRAVVVWLCIAVRDLYLIRGFVAVDLGPRLVLKQWLCGSALRSVDFTRAVAVW